MDGDRPVKREVIVGGLLGAVAVVLWLGRPDAVVSPAETPAKTPEVARPPEVIAARAAPAQVEPAPVAPDEIPIMAAGSEDSSSHGPRHPHPITPTRLRIYRENNLMGAMSRAMDRGRYEELRQLNAQYRDEYPEDEHNLQRAYDLIADCQEQLTDERQAAAREFWKKHRSSQLRRFVRRHCRL